MYHSGFVTRHEQPLTPFHQPALLPQRDLGLQVQLFNHLYGATTIAMAIVCHLYSRMVSVDESKRIGIEDINASNVQEVHSRFYVVLAVYI